MLLLFLLALATSQNVNLKFSLSPSKMQCLGQDLTSQDLVIFQVHSIPATVNTYYVRVYDPLLTLQYSEKNRPTHKFSQAVEHNGRY